MQGQKKTTHFERVEEKKKESHVLGLDPLTWNNHVRIIGEICEHVAREDPKLIEQAQTLYLKKVEQEYPQDQDQRLQFHRIVWSGRFNEICKNYFQENNKKQCCSCFSC